MKILLAAVNSGYIHTALAVRALSAYVCSDSVSFMEFTINERVSDVVRSIYEYGADTVIFSCYIWNIEFVIKTASIIKKIAPDTVIVFGGPEVSYDSVMYMEKYPFVDAIIRGEGEETLKEIIEKGLDVPGVTYRNENGSIVKNESRMPVCDLDTLPFPYSEQEIEENKDKLFYYESSRGCPFSCSYCLSSTVRNVRFKSIDIVKRELALFAKHGARVVKLTDRTFNADRKRAAELIEFLASLECRTQFHFEIAADLINERILEAFRNAPEDRFLLEIGVQSTNDRTIAAIDRKTDFKRIAEAVKALKGSVHMHLDLIAGLPYEDYDSFVKSFNDTMALKPDVLQLGFLKLLRGTKMRDESDLHGYIYSDTPPYEVLGNDYISYDELIHLKDIEYIVERYYNDSVFRNSLEYMSRFYTSPYDMYDNIAEYFKKKGYFALGISQSKLYSILAEFVPDERFKDYLKLDYFINTHNPSTPVWALEPFDKTLLKTRFVLIEEAIKAGELSEYEDVPLKEVIKSVQAERFSYDVLGNGEKRNNVILFDKKYKRVISAKE